jgi:hypothetical protein
MPAIVSFLKNEALYRCLSDHFVGQEVLVSILNDQEADALNQSNEEQKKIAQGTRVVLFDSEYAAHSISDLRSFCQACEISPILICLGASKSDLLPIRFQIDRPFKFGRLLDVMDKCLTTTVDMIPIETIDCSPHGIVKVRQKLWVSGQTDQVALTDKEIMLLYILSQTQSGPLSREILYKCVWGFSNEIETHTLETHIYRLRQKIERDPSDPNILKTHGDRYALINYEGAHK